MKQSKFKQLHQGLTNIAKKVYEAVPLEEEWHMKRIVEKMYENGSGPNFIVIEACLKQMHESGLIKRNGDMYQQIPVELPMTKPKKEIPVVTPNKTGAPETIVTNINVLPPKSKDPTATELLNALAGKLVKLALDVDNIKKDIELVALTVQLEHEAKQNELDKLSQLKALLNSFKD